ncbi:MAG TPA: hypothetical protein VJN50_06430 [Actinomycetota bacterium]|nr:hypothetical protein [Actinomycetota bacterium]
MPEQEGTEEPRRLEEVVDILLDMQRRLREDGSPDETLELEADERKPEKGLLRRSREARSPGPAPPVPRRVAVREKANIVDLAEAERRAEYLGFPPSQRDEAHAPTPVRETPRPKAAPAAQSAIGEVMVTREPPVMPAGAEATPLPKEPVDLRVAALESVVEKRAKTRRAPSAGRPRPAPAPAEEPPPIDGTPVAGSTRPPTLGERLAAEVAQDLGVPGSIVVPEAEEAPRPWEDEDHGDGRSPAPSIDVRLFRMEKELKAIFEEVKRDKVRLLQLDGLLTEWVEKIRSVLIKRFS